MQIVFRSRIKDDRVEEYVDWVKENRDSMDDHAPDGWSWAGTYVTVYNLGTYDVESRWEIEDYGSMAPTDVHDEWARIVRETSDFLVDTEASLVKSVDDVVIMS